MKFESQVEPYLEGTKFSRGLSVKISRGPGRVIDRLSWLENLVSGASVLHVGCVDHLPLIEEKRAKGLWLHERLCRSSARCTGMDINAEGIAYMQEQLGYDDVWCGDFLDSAGPEIPTIEEDRWDYIVIGEVLEHVDDPVRFLRSIRARYAGTAGALVISVPNALKIGNTLRAFRGVELINSDHRFWFTPYTLGKVMWSAGFRPKDFEFVEASPVRVRGPRSLSRFVYFGVFPSQRDTLVMSSSLS